MSLKHTKVKTRQEVKDLFICAHKHSSDSKSGSEMWYWNSIKWYEFEPEYCPEVNFITCFLAELNEEEYLFLGIGEDLEDIEEKGYYWEKSF